MANPIGLSRTNYVRIKDIDALEKAIEAIPGIKYYKADEDPDVLVCFVSDSGDGDGSWPSFYEDEKGEEQEFDFGKDIVPHLKDGEVLVVMGVSHEKERYAAGYASAYKAPSEVGVSISLSDIYSIAAKAFDVESSKITACEY